MLYLHTHHQLEQLANTFSVVVNQPLTHVFTTEIVVVQNAGMARYLSMQVADTSGISANTEYLFPAEFMWRLLRLVSPDIPEESQCTPKTMRFHIMEELSTHFADYPEIHHYILKHGVINTDATWTLSNELAQTLDQYLYYRSDWVKEWEENPEKYASESWQARLWIKCATEKKLIHWLALQDQFKHSIKTMDKRRLPERITFFSMSSLSPGYIELLGEIAKQTDIHMYTINPCNDIYWGDISSEKARAKMPLEQQILSDVGNPLLSSMGKQGRDFIHQLLDLPNVDSDSYQLESLSNSEKKSLLQQCQHDIFTLNNVHTLDNVDSSDNSITINACHTAMREVEVLHDQILAALEADTTLRPADIVVMMPDIEHYAPYIDAIFSSNSFNAPQKSLPYSVADRSPLVVHSMIEALLKILMLKDTRFDVESVFELFDYDAIRQQFNLDESQIEKCRALAKATNIRWGIDAKSRAISDLPNTKEHTWKYALDNILLGYAIGETPDGETLYSVNDNNTSLPPLPFIHIEGGDAIVLANFKRFTDCIFSITHWQQKEYHLDRWIKEIKTLLQNVFAESCDISKILIALNDLKNNANLAQFDQTLTFNVFFKALQDCLQSISGTESYLGHGITFCAMVPMRSVPFKLVALMGMNDGEFPRQDTHLSFDLMASQQRHGDRSRRDEDRYLFLESILAARSRLIISYIGQSIKDNKELPPSVLVSELLDLLAIYTNTPAEKWVCKHPLQAYSSRYFDGSSQLFSYADEYTKLYKSNEVPSQVFIEKRLPELDEQYKTVSLTDLIRFFQSPARSFLKHRFSIQTFEEDITLPVREPFKLESFKDREIRQSIMEDYSNSDVKNVNLIARAKGLLPYGNIGDKVFTQQKGIIENFKKDLPNTKIQDVKPFVLSLGDFELVGEINNIAQPGRIFQQVTQLYAREYIDIWINHLIMNSSAFKLSHFIKQSKAYSPEISFTLKPVDKADELLEALLKYYWEGLHFPLQFFPKSAFNMFKDSGKQEPKKAVTTWQGNMFVTGESNLFENWLLHRTTEFSSDQIPEEFLEVSQNIFGNLFTYLE